MSTNAERIGKVEEKIDGIDDKLSNHIKKQDKFEERMIERIEDLNIVLRVFKWIGYGVTIASSAVIIWFINAFLSTKIK